MADSNQFKLGDTVQLKSGGPIMTITEIRENKFIRCKWFDAGGDFKADSFPSASLDLITDEEGE